MTEKKAPKNSHLHSWHVILKDGTEEDKKGIEFRVGEAGALVINNERDLDVIAYAPGTWTRVELERLDDR